MRRGVTADRGLTLLELVVAIAILAIGAIAATRTMDQARLSLGGAMPRLMAQIAAHNRAEEMRLYGPGRWGTLPARDRVGGVEITLSVGTEVTAGGLIRAEITARTEAGPGAALVTFLPPQRGPEG